MESAIVIDTHFSNTQGVLLHPKKRVFLTLIEASEIETPVFKKPDFQKRVFITFIEALEIETPVFQNPVCYQKRVFLTPYETYEIETPDFPKVGVTC